MAVELWWNDETKELLRETAHFYFVHHESHLESRGLNPCLRGKKPTDTSPTARFLYIGSVHSHASYSTKLSKHVFRILNNEKACIFVLVGAVCSTLLSTFCDNLILLLTRV